MMANIRAVYMVRDNAHEIGSMDLTHPDAKGNVPDGQGYSCISEAPGKTVLVRVESDAATIARLDADPRFARVTDPAVKPTAAVLTKLRAVLTAADVKDSIDGSTATKLIDTLATVHKLTAPEYVKRIAQGITAAKVIAEDKR